MRIQKGSVLTILQFCAISKKYIEQILEMMYDPWDFEDGLVVTYISSCKYTQRNII